MATYSISKANADIGETITLSRSENLNGMTFTFWIIDLQPSDYSFSIGTPLSNSKCLSNIGKLFATHNELSTTVTISNNHTIAHTLTPITISVPTPLYLNSIYTTPIWEMYGSSTFTVDIGEPIEVNFNRNIYNQLKFLVNRWTKGKYAEYTHAHSIEDTDLFDVMDCVDNNFDNFPLWNMVFNIDNYYGHSNKNCNVANDVLTNNAVSTISLNKEFTSSTNYTLEFDYYTSASNRNGFYFGADPSLENGIVMFSSNGGLHVVVDIRNTLVETMTGDSSSATTVYTHTSNLLTSGTHHIRIVRDGTNATFYIDDVELYTHTNVQYNTIGLDKWGYGYNTISNIGITIGD